MNPAYDFNGRVAVVTGAGSGMGLATAQASAGSGAAVVLGDSNGQTVRTATEELAAPATRCSAWFATSSTRSRSPRSLNGPWRPSAAFAFNNAGIQAPPTDAADEPAEIFDRVNAINLRGVWACMKHELRPRRAQGGASSPGASFVLGVALPVDGGYTAR